LVDMTKLSVGEVIRSLESHAPSGTAESWDNVGLLVGDPAWKTTGAVVAIDLSEEAIQEAIDRGYRLIVNHHPCIFPKSKGLAKITAGSDKSGLVFEAIRNGIAVAAYHTNFDRCALEVVQAISSGLGLEPKGRLLDKPQESLLKLAVFVPQTHADQVREVITNAGAGHIGNYDSCTFSSPGQGTFRGSSGTNPFLGKPGLLERAAELRLETVIPKGMERTVIQAMLKAHPYEEVAYDLYALTQSPTSVGLIKGLGYGFWGDFPEPKAFSEVLRDVRRLFKVDGYLVTDCKLQSARASSRSRRARSVGKSERAMIQMIRRVAFAAGKGASVVGAAASLGCDLMITGEAGYHEALAAGRASPKPMRVLELGHTESERFFVKTVQRWLEQSGLKATELFVRTQKYQGA
jgi:dinuclear metal center YbgI/SA1388 family protein